MQAAKERSHSMAHQLSSNQIIEKGLHLSPLETVYKVMLWLTTSFSSALIGVISSNNKKTFPRSVIIEGRS